jgi:hypothetical protein
MVSFILPGRDRDPGSGVSYQPRSDDFPELSGTGALLLTQRCGEKQAKKGGRGGTTFVESAPENIYAEKHYVKNAFVGPVSSGW